MPGTTASSSNLEEHRHLLRELALAIDQAQAAVLTGDIALLEKQTERQQTICHLIKGLGAWPARADEMISPELWQSAKQVAQKNRVLGALLRRAKRCLKIIALVQASRADTYLPSTISRASGLSARAPLHV